MKKNIDGNRTNEPDAHTVWIRVGAQSFRLDGYCDTKPEAEWMRDMLAKMMLNLITMYSANDEALQRGQETPK